MLYGFVPGTPVCWELLEGREHVLVSSVSRCLAQRLHHGKCSVNVSYYTMSVTNLSRQEDRQHWL